MERIVRWTSPRRNFDRVNSDVATATVVVRTAANIEISVLTESSRTLEEK